MTAVDVGRPERPGGRTVGTGRTRATAVLAALLVVLLGLIGWSARTVQASLQQQAQAALDGSGLQARVKVSGRDAVILDASPDEAGRAAAVVAGVPGIRAVGTADAAASLGATAAPPSPSGSPQSTPAGGDEPGTGTKTRNGAGIDPRQGTTVRFAIDRAHLSRRAKRALDTVAEYLATHPRFRVRIQGFTDDTGTVEGNLELSRRRAVAVSHYLERSGVARSRLVVEAYGATRPAGDNGTPRGRAANRRVELVLEKVS